jgi:hypothetical protein
MGRTAPWHSVNSMVHHEDTRCPAGRKISASNRQPGTGGKYLCGECRRLQRLPQLRPSPDGTVSGMRGQRIIRASG